MTQRERNLAMVAAAMLGVAALVGLVMFYQAWASFDERINGVNEQVLEAEAKINKAKADAPKLEHWRRLSLVSDSPNALDKRDEYKGYLRALMNKTGVTLDQFPPTPNDTKSTVLLPSRNKQPVYTGLNFTAIRVKARMSNLVKFLEEFQKSPRMHRIKSMDIERTDNSAKKDPQGMTVTLGIETLVILDADKDVKKAAANDKVKWTASEADALMGLRRGPTGLFVARWALGPTGFVLPPLNPPLASRRYGDIANKNIFIPPPPASPTSDGSAPTDEMVNRMKYNRFIGVVGADGKIEAKLWDASTGITSTRARAGASSGYNKIPMLMTGPVEIGDENVQLVLVNGVVEKIEDRHILLRVAINYGDPSDTQWWRYPNDTNCYKLHRDDLAALAKKGKVRADDALFVFAKRYWSDLVRDKKIVMTGKFYSSHVDGSRGEVVLEDSAVVIIHPESWPPQAPLDATSVGVNRLYPDTYRIYGIHDKHFDLMVANKTAKKEDIDDTYVISADYWDALRQDQLIRQESSSSYVIYKNLIKIEVLERTFDMVVFKVPKKYCQFPGIAKTDDRPGTPPRWHEGFCVLKMGQMLEEALLEPLAEAEVNKLLHPAAAPVAGGN
jgi:hypothetical protein